MKKPATLSDLCVMRGTLPFLQYTILAKRGPIVLGLKVDYAPDVDRFDYTLRSCRHPFCTDVVTEEELATAWVNVAKLTDTNPERAKLVVRSTLGIWPPSGPDAPGIGRLQSWRVELDDNLTFGENCPALAFITSLTDALRLVYPDADVMDADTAFDLCTARLRADVGLPFEAPEEYQLASLAYWTPDEDALPL